MTLVGGSATSGATTALAVGNHSIEAVYSGDAQFTTSSGMLTQTVNPGPASQLVITSQPSTTATAGVPSPRSRW